MTGRPEEPSAAHDEAILAAARGAATRIRTRRAGRGGWAIPLALAAGLAVGLFLPGLRWKAGGTTGEEISAAPRLFVPARAVTRGGGPGVEIPVEQVPADAWYRYIQELLLAGEVQDAERHLHRFVQLHPGYRPAPP